MQKLLQRAKRRMESRTGASFLIAIVFFMLCFFVGATVLAAASANGGRLKAKTEQQQQSALQQRSAAQLLQSQLKLSTNARNRLNVVCGDVYGAGSGYRRAAYLIRGGGALLFASLRHFGYEQPYLYQFFFWQWANTTQP
jgi:hypothetical protein